MLKALISSLLISLVGFLVGLFIPNHSIITDVLGIGGILCFFLSATSVGAFVSGDRMRGNFWSESKKGRQERIRTAAVSAIFGGPLILAAIGLYLL
ncbi:MAG: DUF5316 family protein [Sporolactobacillus sp.]